MKYPGTYLFHSRGIGQYNNDQERSSNETGRSISMFDWQYQVQKKMQHPKIINYSDAELTGMQGYNNNNSNIMVHDNMPAFKKPMTNVTGGEIPEHNLSQNRNRSKFQTTLKCHYSKAQQIK